MALVQRGKVDGRRIVFPKPIGLPDGTEVLVAIDPVSATQTAAGAAEQFSSLPFFGLWKDRSEMNDSAAWVREVREQWQQRSAPPASSTPTS